MEAARGHTAAHAACMEAARRHRAEGEFFFCGITDLESLRQVGTGTDDIAFRQGIGRDLDVKSFESPVVI